MQDRLRRQDMDKLEKDAHEPPYYELTAQILRCSFEVYFRERKVGLFIADLVVEEAVIVELKCCKSLAPEHQAQVINYLKATDISVGLLMNFGNRKLEYKRLLHPSIYPAAEGDPAYPVLF